MLSASQASSTPLHPYGSARDLPSYREMEMQIKGAKVLTLFVARDQRQELFEIERGMTRLAEVVDDFYQRLGPRNWVFHDWLSLEKVEALLGETSDAAAAESRLIELYREPDAMKWWLVWLRSEIGLLERCHQIERAHEHYQAGQFDSCVLHLVAVMDGFVNDFEPEVRRGLAARDPDDMTAWDSIVGHHLGLTHVIKTFTKSIKKRVDEEVFEVYRHGIMHGTVVNYDNVVVATKAWNLLYAVADWAKATRNAATPAEPQPTLKESLEQIQRNRRHKKGSDEFIPRTLDAGSQEFADHRATAAATAFLEAWRHRRWAHLAPFIREALRNCDSAGQEAQRAKDIYGGYPIDDYAITSLTLDGPCSVEVRVTETGSGESRDFQFRMIEWTADDDLALPNDEETVWRIAIWAPHTFFQ